MRITAEPVERLIEEFSRLPGVGDKTASRFTFWLLRGSDQQALALSDAIREMKEKIILCSQCFYITEKDPCPICSSPNRDRSTICVVEEPLDVLALERTREYKGLYHVLHGAIDPVGGVGPDDLKIRELLRRLDGTVAEVILATNPNVEGEATSMYVARLVQPLGVK
ncbi:MAG: recombination mediator RecR, partial [Chloroflexota bacterium]|nr:recombination mediator RecR [Chloroflexota bacterium]